MTTEQKRPDEDDEPTEEELERERHKQQTWKRDESRDLSDRDEERPLKP